MIMKNSYDKLALIGTQTRQKRSTDIFKRLKGLPFFCNQPQSCNGLKCFWDNFPVYRNEKQMRCLRYEQDILQKFDNFPFHVILKPVSAGISTLCLYWLVWMATKDDSWKGRSVGIICGPNINLATKLARRIRVNMFEQHGVFFDTKETYFNLNGVEFEVFPSHHLDSYRSLESPVCTYISEAEMFPLQSVWDVRQVSERYIAKSGGKPYWIIMESTAGQATGLFDKMWKEEPSIYTKTRFDYKIPLAEGMYLQSDIDIALKSPSADRELLCRFSAGSSNTFQSKDIERAQSFDYDPDYINPNSSRVISCDPSWANSEFGILVSEIRDSRIAILLAEEHSKETIENMSDYVASLYRKYFPVSKIYFDGSQLAWGKSLVQRLPELHQNVDFERDIKMYKSNNCNPELNMIIWPIAFTETTNKAMLSSVKQYLMEGQIMINKRFDKLISALHTATDEEGHLQKYSMKHSDVFDCLRMSAHFGYKRSQY